VIPFWPRGEIRVIPGALMCLRFQFEAISTGRVIYESNPELRADYEESVIKRYLDFAPVENIFSAALMERLS